MFRRSFRQFLAEALVHSRYILIALNPYGPAQKYLNDAVNAKSQCREDVQRVHRHVK